MNKKHHKDKKKYIQQLNSWLMSRNCPVWEWWHEHWPHIGHQMYRNHPIWKRKLQHWLLVGGRYVVQLPASYQKCCQHG